MEKHMQGHGKSWNADNENDEKAGGKYISQSIGLCRNAKEKREEMNAVEQLLQLLKSEQSVGTETDFIGSRPSDHYFHSVCWFVCLSVYLFVCAEFFSAVFDPISIKLGHMLYVWV